MTVKELIESLEGFDPNMEVKFAYNYGDYWGTEVASNVGRIDEGQGYYKVTPYLATQKLGRIFRYN